MNGKSGNGAAYKGWQKAALLGCILFGVVGTLVVVGGLVKITSTISEYGGSIGAPVVLVFVIGLLAMWLFAGSGALIVYVTKRVGEIAEKVGVSD